MFLRNENYFVVYVYVAGKGQGKNRQKHAKEGRVERGKCIYDMHSLLICNARTHHAFIILNILCENITIPEVLCGKNLPHVEAMPVVSQMNCWIGKVVRM